MIWSGATDSSGSMWPVPKRPTHSARLQVCRVCEVLFYLPLSHCSCDSTCDEALLLLSYFSYSRLFVSFLFLSPWWWCHQVGVLCLVPVACVIQRLRSTWTFTIISTTYTSSDLVWYIWTLMRNRLMIPTTDLIAIRCRLRGHADELIAADAVRFC